MHRLLSLLVLTLAFASSSFAADTAAKIPPAKEAPPALSQTRDAFLAFALDKAKSYTDKAEVAVSKAVDAVSAEAPLALAEFLRWRACLHGLKALFSITLLIVGPWLFVTHIKRWETNSYGNRLQQGTEVNVIATVIGGIIALGGFITFCSMGASNLLSFVQVLVAPRVYVIEQVLGLFGKGPL